MRHFKFKTFKSFKSFQTFKTFAKTLASYLKCTVRNSNVIPGDPGEGRGRPGIQEGMGSWIPACAGMTPGERQRWIENFRDTTNLSALAAPS